MRTSDVHPICSTYVNALCVLYSGPLLSTVNINNLDSAEEALIAIDAWAQSVSGGGEAVFKQFEYTFTNEELHLLHAAPIELIPTPGVGKYIRILMGSIQTVYNTIRWNNLGIWVYTLDQIDDLQYSPWLQFTPGSENDVDGQVEEGYNQLRWASSFTSGTENSPIYARYPSLVAPLPVDADDELTIYLTYEIVTL